VLEGENLASVAQRALRQEPELGQAVEDDPGRVQLRHPVEDHLGGLTQLHLRGMEDALVALAVERRLGGHQLEEGDPLEGPAVSADDEAELAFGLRQRHVEGGLAQTHALHEELQGEGGLARARLALEEVEAVPVEAAAEDVVQAPVAGGEARRVFAVGFLVACGTRHRLPLSPTRHATLGCCAPVSQPELPSAEAPTAAWVS
jgi:hypothetical protein